jgi:GNAT superfamily N-acetyltransferase
VAEDVPRTVELRGGDPVSELSQAGEAATSGTAVAIGGCASGAIHIAHLDVRLIEDGTYFVHEADGELVACGGWSRRAKLYTGSGGVDDDQRLLDPAREPARIRAMFVRGDWARRGIGRAILEACERAARSEGFQSLVLMATLPGEPLYRAFGFREVERLDIQLPDGATAGGVLMERPITPEGR